MNFSDHDMRCAAEVSNFMMRLYEIDPIRYDEAINHGIPHGDLAYGAALADWRRKGRPHGCYFSYAPGQEECKLLIAFRKEISDEFGLEILTIEEGETCRRHNPLPTVKVHDWGLN